MSNRWFLCLLMGLLAPQVTTAEDLTVGVCDAVKRPSPSRVAMTGLAQVTKEGLIVGDVACPVFRFRKVSIPTAVIVHIGSFGSDELKTRFSAIRPSLDSARIRIVVQGTIECKADLRFDISDDGRDVTGGNGYGTHGFYKCSMADGRLESLERFAKR